MKIKIKTQPVKVSETTEKTTVTSPTQEVAAISDEHDEAKEKFLKRRMGLFAPRERVLFRHREDRSPETVVA